jgi:hypothetical protein
MPRERRQDMDVRSARAHGASSECGNPTKSDPTRSKAFLVTFVAFTKVTRCKSGTVIRATKNKGYTPDLNASTPTKKNAQKNGQPKLPKMPCVLFL